MAVQNGFLLMKRKRCDDLGVRKKRFVIWGGRAEYPVKIIDLWPSRCVAAPSRSATVRDASSGFGSRTF